MYYYQYHHIIIVIIAIFVIIVMISALLGFPSVRQAETTPNKHSMWLWTGDPPTKLCVYIYIYIY